MRMDMRGLMNFGDYARRVSKMENLVDQYFRELKAIQKKAYDRGLPPQWEKSQAKDLRAKLEKDIEEVDTDFTILLTKEVGKTFIPENENWQARQYHALAIEQELRGKPPKQINDLFEQSLGSSPERVMEFRRLAKAMMTEAPAEEIHRFMQLEQRAKPDVEVKADMIKTGRESMKHLTKVVKNHLLSIADSHERTDHIPGKIGTMEIFEQGLENVVRNMKEAGGIEPDGTPLKDTVKRMMTSTGE